MLLTCYVGNNASGNPAALTGLMPGGAGVQNTFTSGGLGGIYLTGSGKLEPIEREVLDATQSGGVATPAPQGAVLAWNPLAANNAGAALWTIPGQSSFAGLYGQFGVIVKAASTNPIDVGPAGSGSTAVVVISGPVLALCTAQSAGGGITPGMFLVSDGAGNLQPAQPPTAAPTPTVAPIGTAGPTTVSYALVAVGANGTFSAIGPVGTTATSNATLTAVNYNFLTWTPSTDAIGYYIVRTVAPTNPNTVGTIGYAPAGASSFSDTGLAIMPGTSATQPFVSFAAAATPTVTQIPGSIAGSTSWSYRVAAVAPNGVWGAPSSAGTFATGNATLSATNANKLTWAATPGASQYAVQRSASGGNPASTGFIGFASAAAATTGFIDNGIVASTYTPVTVPTAIPGPGAALARAIGSLPAGTTAPTLVAVFVGAS